jgi:DNA-binding NarL/FixJ family response regulator
MVDWDSLNDHERRLVGGLMEALIHARSLPELVGGTEKYLTQLVSADCLAMCASRLGQPDLDEWLVARIPDVYFADYAGRKQDDLIRDANLRQPNVVLRDTDILAHEDLVKSPVYQFGLDVGFPLEHVLAVYLTQAGWEGNGGLSAYRMTRRPFSDHERDLIQQLTPMIGDAIQKCRVFVERQLMDHLMELQPEDQKPMYLVMAGPEEVVRKTGPVSTLLESWFSPKELGEGSVRLPQVLKDKLASLMKRTGRVETGLETWERRGEGESLRVTFIQLPYVEGRSYWQLRFQEVVHPLLASWLTKLTPKEVQITHLLVQGLSDKEIADKARSTVGTVKKQLVSIYRKLKADGVEGRRDIIARALKPKKKN